MPPIHVMIKPASGLCNMRCRYCFYSDETSKRAVKSYGLMSEDTLYAVLRRVLQFADRECTIAFQGGEPTLAGLPFFEKVMEFERALNEKNVRIENAIQTNGYVVDDAWAAFFAKNRWLVGISLDGPKQLHDAMRPDAAGKGTYNRVMRAIQLFKNHGVEYNVLTVVTAESARSIGKIYGFFERNGIAYQQYIPCLDPLGEGYGGQDYSLTPALYGRYLKSLFDCWYQDALRGKMVYNRYFYGLLAILQGQMPEACEMRGVCGRQFVVEADGGVYPCDFYMLDQWRLGNFVTDTFEDIERRREELAFIEPSRTVHPDCRACKWVQLCRGGCRRDREPMENGRLAKNHLCEAYREFLEYAAPKLQSLLVQARKAGLRG